MRRLVPVGMLLRSAFLNSLIYIDFSTRRPPDVLEQPSQSQSLRNIDLEESAFSLLPRANGGSNQSFPTLTTSRSALGPFLFTPASFTKLGL